MKQVVVVVPTVKAGMDFWMSNPAVKAADVEFWSFKPLKPAVNATNIDFWRSNPAVKAADIQFWDFEPAVKAGDIDFWGFKPAVTESSRHGICSFEPALKMQLAWILEVWICSESSRHGFWRFGLAVNAAHMDSEVRN